MKGQPHANPFFIAGLTLSVLALTPTAAAQQTLCSPRDNVVGQLAKKYSEAPAAIGVTNKGGLMEVWTARDGGTWTIFVTTPQGMSCFVAAGEGWHTMKYKPAEPQA